MERNLDVYERSVCEFNFGQPGTEQDYVVKGDLDKELLEEKNRIMSDMIAMALACNLTRTFSVTFSPLQSDVLFYQDGIGATQGSHEMTHKHTDKNLERIHKSVIFIMHQFAYLLGRLDSYAVGDGTLLDHCCIMATSEVENGSSHQYKSMPVVLAGGAGGALKTGLHVRREEKDRVLCNQILLTCLRAVGINQASIGDERGRSDSTFLSL